MTFTISDESGKVVATFTANDHKGYEFVAKKYPDHIINPEPDFQKTYIEEL